MIDLYTWTTPNGRKVSIMLEELGLSYDVHTVNIGKGEQFDPAFLKISPNNKIPAIVDRDSQLSVFESGAILVYLAEKTSSPLLPANGKARASTLEWLMFQMASVGPMFGQLNHFINAAPEQIPYAIKRYAEETKRILGVMNTRLGETAFLAGDYSIADIATYPWTLALANRSADLGMNEKEIGNVADWLERVGARKAVKAGMAIPQL